MVVSQEYTYLCNTKKEQTMTSNTSSNDWLTAQIEIEGQNTIPEMTTNDIELMVEMLNDIEFNQEEEDFRIHPSEYVSNYWDGF